MDGLRTQAQQRFLQEQKFASEKDLVRVEIPLITVAKFRTETTVGEAKILWNESEGLRDLINQPIENTDKESATATLKLVKFDRDISGALLIGQQLFMDIFQDFGFDPYWLHMVLCSVYGFFQLRKEGGALYTFYLNTVSYTLLWSHNFHEVSTKVIIIPRKAKRVSDHGPIFSSFLRSMNHHKDLINDWRFCSFLCAIQLVQWIEDSVGKNLGRIRSAEAKTEHGPWLEKGEARFPPGIDELVEKSKDMGLSLTALANVVRHASIARTILGDLSSHQQPSHHQLASSQTSTSNTSTPQSSVPQSTPTHSQIIQSSTSSASSITGKPSSADMIAGAIVLLEGQIESGNLQASYLQERARTQHSVIFNLLARQDAESSKNIAQSAKDDSYSMKAIAIMTMVFLPPTFFATLFAMPMLQWQEPRIMQPNFWIYWAFAVPSTALVLMIWYLTSNSQTIFHKNVRVNVSRKEYEVDKV